MISFHIHGVAFLKKYPKQKSPPVPALRKVSTDDVEASCS